MHPKMRIILPQNRLQSAPIEVNKKQSNFNVQHQHSAQPLAPIADNPEVRNIVPIQIVKHGQKQKALKFREKQLSQDVESRREKMKENGGPVMEGFEEVESGGNYNDIMNKISMMDLPRPYTRVNPEEVVSSNKSLTCLLFITNSLYRWNLILMSESMKLSINHHRTTIITMHNQVNVTCNQ